jgi:hypothetical protein
MQQGRLSCIIETEEEQLSVLIEKSKRGEDIVDYGGSAKREIILSAISTDPSQTLRSQDITSAGNPAKVGEQAVVTSGFNTYTN